jgi:N-acetylmuramoyl-L-alanine amidase
LAEAGIGLWSSRSSATCGEQAFAEQLSRFGYGVPPQVDVPLDAVVTAFQRHFRPSCIDGVADGECAAILAALLAR